MKKLTQKQKKAAPNKCGNCYDGKLLMAGETCGVCGNHEPVPPKKKRKRKPASAAALRKLLQFDSAGVLNPGRLLDALDRKCVYCGCTDSKACAGGCSWIVRHPKTNTGVCSCCVKELPGIAVGLLSIAPPREGQCWMQVLSGPNAGEGQPVDAKLLEDTLVKFYKKHF